MLHHSWATWWLWALFFGGSLSSSQTLSYRACKCSSSVFQLSLQFSHDQHAVGGTLRIGQRPNQLLHTRIQNPDACTARHWFLLRSAFADSNFAEHLIQIFLTFLYLAGGSWQLGLICLPVGLYHTFRVIKRAPLLKHGVFICFFRRPPTPRKHCQLLETTLFSSNCLELSALRFSSLLTIFLPSVLSALRKIF